MLDVMLHLAFITYVNSGEKIDENRWVLSDARCDNVFQVGLALLRSDTVKMIWFVS